MGIVRHANRESLLLRSHREEEKTAEKGAVKYAESTIEDSSYLDEFSKMSVTGFRIVIAPVVLSCRNAEDPPV